MTRVAINGFGRIGRTFFRMALDNPSFEIVAINDLGDIENLAYLLKYDTAYGRGTHDVSTKDGNLVVDGKTIACHAERDPLNLPWKDTDIDIVVEATGFFASYEKAKVHLEAGAKRVVISAPVKDDPVAAGIEGATVLMGANESVLETCSVSSNASCTTNATSPLIAILKEDIGIEKALLNTVHAYTSTQALVDRPNAKDFRKGRSAAQNIIPTSTGAAVATTKVHTELDGQFDGIAMRVPVPVGSIVDVTFVANRETTVEEVNKVLTEAAATDRWKNLFAVTNEPIVSSDIIGARYASIADLAFTRVVGGNLVKVLAWYDNETSYTHTLVEHVAAIAGFFNKGK
ncbi:MAG: type I glyceraldehyde-3-phosphate dehydrogenase [Candidatus Pacebacteria bacterium]|nr:type I glyceraldehyde-3-phosphate dehydrogenase [Candidatus Paceibacterota bacterium]